MTVKITTEFQARFWSKVHRSEGCWEWTGAHSACGYGQLRSRGVTYYAHRVSMQIAGVGLDESTWVLHHCDNPPCVRPDHLFLGTPKDNSQDMNSKGRGRGKPHPGETNCNAKLTEREVFEIRSLYAEGQRQVDLARRFGVTQANISIIVRGQGWAHLEYDRRAFMSLTNAEVA